MGMYVSHRGVVALMRKDSAEGSSAYVWRSCCDEKTFLDILYFSFWFVAALVRVFDFVAQFKRFIRPKTFQQREDEKRVFIRCRFQTKRVAYRDAEKPHRQHGPENSAE
jgi:hypothetical protein